MAQNQEVEQFNKVLELVNILKEGLCCEEPVTLKGERTVNGSLKRCIAELKIDGYVTFIGSPEKYSERAMIHLSRRINHPKGYMELGEIQSEITRKLGYCMIEGLGPIPEYTTEDLSIKLETAEAHNLIWSPEHHDNIRETSYKGEEGALIVIHSAKEDANVFIDNLYQSFNQAIAAKGRRLGKLNIQPKAADLVQKDKTQDDGRTM